MSLAWPPGEFRRHEIPREAWSAFESVVRIEEYLGQSDNQPVF